MPTEALRSEKKGLNSGSHKQAQHALQESKMRMQENYQSLFFTFSTLLFLLSHFPNHLQPPNCPYMLHSSRTLNTLPFLKNKTPIPFFALGYSFLKIYS